MNLNLTLIGQAISFAIFVYICMKFIWPHMLQALQARQEKIAKGLADAQQATERLQAAKQEVEQLLVEGKKQVRDIINGAQDEAKAVIENARQQAKEQGANIIAQAQQEADSAIDQSKKELQKEFAALVLNGVSQVVGRDVKQGDHQKLLDDLSINV